MGGVEVSTQYYESGRISIPNVTGNISITISAVSQAAENEFNKNDSDVLITGRINSSGAAVAYQSGQLVTGFIPATVGDVIQLTTDKDNKTNSYTGLIAFYTADKAYLRQMQGTNSYWSWDADNRNGTITVPAVYDSTDLSGTAYIRLCVAYTDVDSITVTK